MTLFMNDYLSFFIFPVPNKQCTIIDNLLLAEQRYCQQQSKKGRFYHIQNIIEINKSNNNNDGVKLFPFDCLDVFFSSRYLSSKTMPTRIYLFLTIERKNSK